MTVQTTERLVIYQGNGATTAFPFSFLIPEDTLSVSIINWASKAVEEVLTLADYSVSGLGDPLGGTVTYNPMAGALPSDKGLLILRTVPFTQDLDIEPFGGFNPDTLEAQLDQIVMQVQQINETQNRSLVVLPGQTPPDVAVIAAASGNAANAAASAVEAAGFSAKAQEWAENPKDAEVDPGQYSALHWAAKAQELRDQVDALLATGRVPLGTIIHSAIPQTDNGFLLCDGAPVTALYPDLRAALIAAGNPFGVSGADPLLPDEVTVSRFRRAANGSIPLGTVQDDTVGPHNHPARASASGFTGGSASLQYAPGDNNGTVLVPGGGAINGVQNNTGTTETRPKSIAYLPYIKAFGSIAIEGMADLSQLLTAIASEASAILGENNTELMTPLRTRQAVAAYNKWRTFEAFPSAQAFVAFTDLGIYRTLRVTTSLIKTDTVGQIMLQVSTDNGATWITTTDYSTTVLSSNNGGAPQGGVGTVSAFFLNNGVAGSEESISSSEFSAFNKAAVTMMNGREQTVQPGTIISALRSGRRGAAVAYNALRILGNTGVISGHIAIECLEG